MSSQTSVQRKAMKYGQLTLFMIPLGIATNFIAAQIVILLKLPVYLDTIGTVLVGVLCGPMAGALVGLLTNLINAITQPTLIPFALVSIAVGLVAGWLSQLGWFRKFWQILVWAVVFGLIGGFGGSLITIWVFGGLDAAGSAYVVAALHALGMPLNTAVFVASVPLDLLDKIPTVLIVFLILKRLPSRVLIKLPLGAQYLKRKKPHNSSTARPAATDELTLGR